MSLSCGSAGTSRTPGTWPQSSWTLPKSLCSTSGEDPFSVQLLTWLLSPALPAMEAQLPRHLLIAGVPLIHPPTGIRPCQWPSCSATRHLSTRWRGRLTRPAISAQPAMTRRCCRAPNGSPLPSLSQYLSKCHTQPAFTFLCYSSIHLLCVSCLICFRFLFFFCISSSFCVSVGGAFGPCAVLISRV